jgi:ABC-type lipoprotein export system ATPase subunit/predicted RNase H-like HicB family nuclease
MTAQRYRIVVESDDATNYSAYSPDIPGVVATGATREECERELQEAIGFHLEGLDPNETDSGAGADKPPVLSFEGVSKRYPDGPRVTVVLDPVSFEIPAGAQVGVFGGRRSGKSTLLRLAAGIETPNEGRVRFEGRDIASMSRRKRERFMCDRVASIVEPVGPGQNVRVADYVGLPLRARGRSRREAARSARRLLSRVGIPDRSDELMKSLSLADRWWAMLAQALAQEPSLLLVDEPEAIGAYSERLSLIEMLRSTASELQMTLMIASGDLTTMRGMETVMNIGMGELHLSIPAEKFIAFPRREEVTEAEIIEFPARSDPSERRLSG